MNGPRIYNLFPLLAGPVPAWSSHLARIAEMGFNWVYVNPFHYPGFSGSLYAVKDHFRLNPLFAGDGTRDADRLLRDFTAEAESHGLSVMMDLVINHTSKDAVLVGEHPAWFSRDAEGALKSPGAVDPDNPEVITVWGDLAEIDYSDRPERAAIVAYWQNLVRHYSALGFHGFRADAAYKVPSEVWREVINSAREDAPDALFAAETVGAAREETEALHAAGFDFLFNSAKWWDFKAPWLLEQYEQFRHIAPSIAFPESHDTERLVSEIARAGLRDPETVEAIYRQRYLFAATFSAGVLMPMGYEYGFRRKLDVVTTRPADWEDPLFDLTAFVAEINAIKADTVILNQEGPQRWSRPRSHGVVSLLRVAETGDDWVLTLVNPDNHRGHNLSARRLRDVDIVLPGVEITPGQGGTRLTETTTLRFGPAEARVFRSGGPADAPAARETPERGEVQDHALPGHLHSTAIIIRGVEPEIDCGRYAVKREAGDAFEIRAEIFKEGHDRIAAVIMYRREDSDHWAEAPMTLVEPGLDLWSGTVALEENAHYRYTIEAWPDDYASWVGEVRKKHAAGQKIGLELAEGRHLVEAALDRASRDDRRQIERALAEIDGVVGDDDRLALMTGERLRRLMGRAPDRGRAVRYGHELRVIADRPAARFAAWYEIFPRSQGKDPNASATFADCTARLDEVRDMGFDVVYLVPIHPIGRSHRKGRNNSTTAGPDDPGSPYAIGAEEGGHDAVHPELGTLEDFRAFVAATHERGMEVALDFAIQCSPDHPWLNEHPDWFNFRPDGTVKYAENPPKKYQDIVNVNFYGPHRDALWRALADVVLFWVDQGVRIYRVDNPHTKPVPFWEWLIGEVQAQHPDVIFLSEAFTRPAMLKMLAKVGFSQSYTYFTWRNFKGELTDYLTELTQGECRDYLRPNFFPSTPDILPAFLQTGGRAAFQIRLVLAATLSSVYGIYNGFELCEATAVPGTEEYANSEKYQYQVWDWDRPGNIKDYITRVNRIRRENPALHELRNLRFHQASDDNVLFYGKATAERDNMVLIAVNLDPFDAHEAELSIPLDEMGIPETEAYEVEELLSGARHLWRGRTQSLRFDPAVNPAAIFRVSAWHRIDYREPCF